MLENWLGKRYLCIMFVSAIINLAGFAIILRLINYYGCISLKHVCVIDEYRNSVSVSVIISWRNRV